MKKNIESPILPINSQDWKPNSWRSKPQTQMPQYQDLTALKEVTDRLMQYPPLIYEGEILRLKDQLAQVERGEAFLLQGGDCAESFADLRFETVRDNFRVLLQMAVVLTLGQKRPVVKVGRVAGQFAKPRSSDFETRNGVSLPAYRGDIINAHQFDPEARRPDPMRMETAYFQSTAKMNLLRALSKGGFADLQKIHSWNLQFVDRSEFQHQYRSVVQRIDESLGFMKAAGLEIGSGPLSMVEFFTSHEALLLPYEESLTRQSETGDSYYAGSTHMIWIGDRTRQLEGAHVEFASGVANPIGLKCGPQMQSDELLRLVDRLNPMNESGRLTLITRMGAQKIESILPKLIRRMKSEGRKLVWCCDPMHGNTTTTGQGFKTRSFKDVLSEVRQFLDMHRAEGSIAGGLHLELTGRDVVECTGGGQEITEDQIQTENYETLCDPRLNATQALELAFQMIK